MIAIDGLVLADFRIPESPGFLPACEDLDVLRKRSLIALACNDAISLLVLDLFGDGPLTAHRIDSDDGALGTVELYQSTLNNAGATLSVGSGSRMGTFYLYGGDAVVSDNVIKDGGSGLQSSGGALDDDKFEGALNLQAGSLSIDDGATFTGAGGTSADSITPAGA